MLTIVDNNYFTEMKGQQAEHKQNANFCPVNSCAEIIFNNEDGSPITNHSNHIIILTLVDAEDVYKF